MIEALLREAVRQRVTVINIDTSRRGVCVSTWKAFGTYQTTYGTDPIETLTDALKKVTTNGDLTDLLGD